MRRKIFQAIRVKDSLGLSQLLKRGHSPRRLPKDDDLPLGHAAEFSTPEIVRLLLEAGAPPEDYDVRDFSPLYRAVYQRHEDRGRLDIVRMLVDAGADMRRFTGSPRLRSLARRRQTVFPRLVQTRQRAKRAKPVSGQT